MRQFVLDAPPQDDGTVRLKNKDYHYLTNVLRLKAGDLVDARLPNGELITMAVAKLLPAEKTLILARTFLGTAAELNESARGGERAIATAAAPRSILLQWLARPIKMDGIIRQAAECGVERVIPVIGAYSQKNNAGYGKRLDRWLRIVKEARQQSGSPTATDVGAPLSLPSALEYCAQYGTGKSRRALFLWERRQKTRRLCEILSPRPDIVVLAVGAEGGYSEEEVKTLEKADFAPVHFYTNVLRAETAALYGVAAVQTIISETSTWTNQ